MAEDGLIALREELGGDPPPGVAALGDEQLAHLAAAVRNVRHRQAQELQRAGEQAFNLIPWLLRGPIRRLFS